MKVFLSLSLFLFPLFKTIPLQAREGKVFFVNGRWLRGDIQVQSQPSGRELVVIAYKSGAITVDKSQVKKIVYSLKAGEKNGTSGSMTHRFSEGVNSKVVRSSSLNPLFGFETYIQEASKKNQIDPKLIKAVMKQESNFQTKVVSKKGARGLMQLMPETAKILGVQDIFDPRENIHAGTRYLRAMLEQFNWDLNLALAAYNAGPQVVKKYRTLPPYPETEDYVSKVMSTYQSQLRGNKLVVLLDKTGKLVITDLPYLP